MRKNQLSAARDRSTADLAVAPDKQPARPRGRPRSEAAAAAVLEAGYQLSAELGLRGATMNAIAQQSGVSKMTIYKWWDSRLELLIDAFLQRATAVLPLSEANPPPQAIYAHAMKYINALKGDLGRVQLAVIADCLAETGSAEMFVERYLSLRRKLGTSVIARGQRDGSIRSTRPADALYDQIYGTIFYRFLFELKGLNRAFVKSLVEATFEINLPD